MNTKRLDKLSNTADRAMIRFRAAKNPTAHLSLNRCSKRLDVAIEMLKLLRKEAETANLADRFSITYNTRYAIEEIKFVQNTIIPNMEKMFELIDKLDTRDFAK